MPFITDNDPRRLAYVAVQRIAPGLTVSSLVNSAATDAVIGTVQCKDGVTWQFYSASNVAYPPRVIPQRHETRSIDIHACLPRWVGRVYFGDFK